MMLKLTVKMRENTLPLLKLWSQSDGLLIQSMLLQVVIKFASIPQQLMHAEFEGVFFICV